MAVVTGLDNVAVDHGLELVIDGLTWLNIAETRDAKRAGGARMNEIEAKRMTDTRASLRYRKTARIVGFVDQEPGSVRYVGVNYCVVILGRDSVDGDQCTSMPSGGLHAGSSWSALRKMDLMPGL